MDLHLNKDISSAIPSIREYDQSLEKQNLWWTVVAMVGKINNQNLQSQLIDSISDTQVQFDELRSNLISSMTHRYMDKLETEMKLKSQAFIDVLNRNLFERTADVGFLSTDVDIVNYLKDGNFSAAQRTLIENRLVEYVKKYSVYDDVVLVSMKGDVVASLKGEQDHHRVNLQTEFWQQVIRKNDFVEVDVVIEGINHDELPLSYLHRVEHNGEVLGILCLVFKFEDELSRIQKALTGEQESVQFALTDADRKVLFSHAKKTHTSLPNMSLNKLELLTIDRQSYFVYATRAKGYQGFEGLPWLSYCFVPVESALKVEDTDSRLNLSPTSALFPLDLYELNLRINTALLIVILNGKIISLKNDVKAFLPVLDAFQEIGSEIQNIFSDSISHIHHLSYQTIATEVALGAKLAIEIMDRNLYERANDCRWWALSHLFRETLSDNELSNDKVHQVESTLKSINQLYTVYTNIFVYDTQGRVIADSNETLNESNVRLASQPEVIRTLKLDDSQQYSVSAFEQTALYNEQQTYVYHARIMGLAQEPLTVGGIGIVFDAKPEFKAILEDFMPKKADGQVYEHSFSVFVDQHYNIISCSENDVALQVGDKIDLKKKIVQSETDLNGYFSEVCYGREFLIGYQVSLGYREYKNDDGYQNDLIALVFVPC